MQEKKLYVGNLSYNVTEDRLKELFSQQGQVKEAVVIKDKYTSRSRGFGFVEFESSEDAQKAMDALNDTEYEGRTLRINEAREKTDRDRDRKRY